MKLSQTGTQDINWEAIVCRQSPMTQLIGSVVMAMLFTFFPLMWWWLEAPTWVIGMCLFAAILVVPISLGEAFAAVRKTNWLLAIQSDGIWVNLRSFRNRNFAPALTVVHLPWSDLDSAAATDGLTKLSSNASSIGRTAYLEIQLADHVQTDPLQQAIMEEMQRRSMPKRFAGVKTTGRSQHAAIQLTKGNRLQFAWRSSMDSITPKLNEVLGELSRKIEIEDEPAPAGTVIWHSDTSSPESSSEQTAALHAEVLELAELGQLLEAIRLYRVRTGCGLKEARDSVNNLLKAP